MTRMVAISCCWRRLMRVMLCTVCRWVELDTLLLDVFWQGLVMAQGKVELRLLHEDQAQITGDVDRLRQLLLNLVDNAIKYTPAGGKVTLALYREQGHVRIEVADNGPGIADKYLPHIFERFYRGLDRARSRQLGAAVWGCPLLNGWHRRTTARYRCKVRWAQAAPSRCGCRWMTNFRRREDCRKP